MGLMIDSCGFSGICKSCSPVKTLSLFTAKKFFNKSGYTAVEEPTSHLFMDQGSKEQNRDCQYDNLGQWKT